MTNHPSRAWRARAQHAADAYLQRIATERPELAPFAAQAARIIRLVYLDGYGDGRQDSRRPPKVPPP